MIDEIIKELAETNDKIIKLGENPDIFPEVSEMEHHMKTVFSMLYILKGKENE